MATETTGSAYSPVEVLKSFTREADPYVHGGPEIEAIQLEAAQDLFERRRAEIPVLDRRAHDLGIEKITSPADLVPLLFAHQTYKSYPDSFLLHNRWDRMNLWLDSLSATKAAEVDVSDVGDADAWMARLGEHGHYVLPSSGTSGKTSFLNRTEWDRGLTQQNVVSSIRLTQGIPDAARDRPVFLLGPRNGHHIFVEVMRGIADQFGRPDSTYWLSDVALTEVDTQRQAQLRAKVNAGTATPGEIQALEEDARKRQGQIREGVASLAEALIDHRGEPVMLVGLWLPHWLLMDEAHERGMKDGELDRNSTVFVGGGLKGAQLPADFREQLSRFHGLAPERYHRAYGMVEMMGQFLWCEGSRYHRPPWIDMLILDKTGERLLDAHDGVAEGRMAFFDSAVEARWGGIITGDKVDVDFSPCPCGRRSPTITSVMRYTDLAEGDDKLSCAGTMSSYVRGVIEE